MTLNQEMSRQRYPTRYPPVWLLLGTGCNCISLTQQGKIIRIAVSIGAVLHVS